MKFLRLVLASLLAVAVQCGIAEAHPERVAGLVLSVLPEQHAIVIRRDQNGSAPQLTTLFKLSPRVNMESMRDGDRIVGLMDDDAKPPVLDEIQVTAHGAVNVVVPLSKGDQMPPTEFTDQRGRHWNFTDLRGKYVVLSFIYTRCKDLAECPLVSSHFGVLQQKLVGPYHLVEMTLDPGYDRPPVLANYGKRYGADPNRWTFGTGDPQTVLDFDRRFGLDPFADPSLGLIHTERTVLVDPKGYIIDFIDLAGWNPDDVVARLRPSTHVMTMLDRVEFELNKMTVAICGNGATGYNGLEDLAIILAILGAAGWMLLRIARFIFAKPSTRVPPQ